MKPEMPATIPASMVSANNGLEVISVRMVWPAGIDSYRELENDEPKTNKIGITAIRPTVHLPCVVLGMSLQDRSDIPTSFLRKGLHYRCHLTDELNHPEPAKDTCSEPFGFAQDKPNR